METNYGKVIAKFFAKPNSVFMIDEDPGFSIELHEATKDRGFWRALINVYEAELKLFNAQLTLLGERLLQLQALKARKHWSIDLSTESLINPNNDMGPKSLKALENVIAYMEASLELKLKRADLLGDNKKAEKGIQQYRSLRKDALKARNIMFIRETRAIWDAIEARSGQLMEVAKVIDDWQTMDLPKPVVILGNLASPQQQLPHTCCDPLDSKGGPHMPRVGLSVVVIDMIIGDEGRPKPTVDPRQTAI